MSEHSTDWEDSLEECPEYNCPHRWARDELAAHLQWDHNYSEYKAEEKVEEVFTS